MWIQGLLLCLLLQLQALDAFQVPACSVDRTVIEGLEFICHLAQSPLLLLGLPRHTEALSACEKEKPGQLGPRVSHNTNNTTYIFLSLVYFCSEFRSFIEESTYLEQGVLQAQWWPAACSFCHSHLWGKECDESFKVYLFYPLGWDVVIAFLRSCVTDTVPLHSY